jgi:hypothetical protein
LIIGSVAIYKQYWSNCFQTKVGENRKINCWISRKQFQFYQRFWRHTTQPTFGLNTFPTRQKIFGATAWRRNLRFFEIKSEDLKNWIKIFASSSNGSREIKWLL